MSRRGTVAKVSRTDNGIPIEEQVTKTTVFNLDGVGKSFRDGTTDHWVFRNLTYEISSNAKVVLWGPSGSGKSTLLNLLAGLMLPDLGSIVFSTSDMSTALEQLSDTDRLQYRRDHVGFVYQFYNLIPTLTVRENVELPLELTRRKTLRERALERLSELGLDRRLDAFPHTLSGGEQQRTAIARALAHEPVVLLADEPTGNLDRKNADQVIDLLWRATEKTQTTVIIASHDEHIRNRADTVLELAI